MFGLEDMTPPSAQVVGKVMQLLQGVRSNSLIEYGKMTRVEPVTLVDKGCVMIPQLTDVLQTLNTLFAAYYLQAISLSCHIGNIDVIKLLDAVNPNRDLGAMAAAGLGHIITKEDFKHYLPMFNISMEADDKTKPLKEKAKLPYGFDALTAGTSDASSAEGNIGQAMEASNLAIGKLINVTIEAEGAKAVIPVQVRLDIMEIAADAMIRVFSSYKSEKSMKERWHGWRSGQLSFIRDLIFCTDLIDEHRKALMNDQERILADTFARIRNNQMAGVASGSPSVASASTLVVMTDESMKRLERQIMGRFNDFKVRERVFEETYAMIFCVIIPDRELVTFYYRSIPHGTTVSFRDLKGSSKDANVDILKVLQAFQSGNSPSL